MDEHCSEETSDSDNEIGSNLIATVAHQTVNKVDEQSAPAVCGLHDVKWQIQIWLLSVPQCHDVHYKYH